MLKRYRFGSWSLVALASGQLFSSLGDFLFFVALMVAIYEQTGSALAVGYLTVAQIAPRLLLAPMAGVWIDRSNPKRVMIVSDLLRGVTVLFLLLNHSTTAIYIVSALLSCLSIFFNPARSALLPRLFQGELLLRSNASISMCASLMRMVGPAIGAVLTAKAGIVPAVWANAASFAISALFVSTLPFAWEKPPAQTQSTSQPRAWEMLGDGLKYLAKSPVVLTILGAGAFSSAGITAVSTLLVSYATEQMKIGSSALGYLTSAEGIGAVAAGAGIGFLSSRIQSRNLFALGYGLVAVSIFALTGIRAVPLAMLAIGIAGAGMVASNVAEETRLQLAISPAMMGRVFSLIAVIYTLIQLAAAPLAGLVADRFGVRSVFVACGTLIAIAGVYLWMSLGSTAMRSQEGLKSAESQG